MGDAGEKTARKPPPPSNSKSRIRERDGASLATTFRRATSVKK